MAETRYDAVVVGAGPNGLAAAALLADHGLEVLLVEATDRVGGGLCTEELTLPGYRHDVCSAVHPLAISSPYFRTLPLADHGLEWTQPDPPLAHALEPGRSVLLHRSMSDTVDELGPDGERYRSLVDPFVRRWAGFAPEILAPAHLPIHPILLARFGLHALRSATALLEARFRTPEARALLAGSAAHGFLPLDRRGSAAGGLVLTIAAHVRGWPLPRAGAGTLARALEGYVRARGVEIRTGWKVETVDELPPSRAVLLDLTPRQIVSVAGDRFPDRYRDRLSSYRYGPGAFKVDWALDGPVPWSDPRTATAGTVHLGGSFQEMIASESAPWRGRVSERPFVILVQPTVADPTRAPGDGHVAWAYCHVPNGFGNDVTTRIEDQVERFAPGFRDRILGRSVMGPSELEARNPNLVGGDIVGGVQDLRQIVARPVARLDPYSTPDPTIFLCSASTPPGGGVHGMCGYHGARSALWRAFGIDVPRVPGPVTAPRRPPGSPRRKG